MPHRKVEYHRNAIMLHIFVEHRVHILEVILRMLVFIELSYDDATNMGK